MLQSEYRARIEQLRAHLCDQGYSSSALRNYPRIARRFLDYLYDHVRAVETALPADVEDFLRRERRVYRNRHGRSPSNIPMWRREHTTPLRLILRLVQGQWPPEPASNLETKRKALAKVDTSTRPSKPPRWKRDPDLLVLAQFAVANVGK
jgi:hypothetical protein